jgi:hypothetical protein
MITNVAKELLTKKIYPTFKDYKEATSAYVQRNDREFYNTFGSRRWNLYYERKLRKKVSAKVEFYNMKIY